MNPGSALCGLRPLRHHRCTATAHSTASTTEENSRSAPCPYIEPGHHNAIADAKETSADLVLVPPKFEASVRSAGL
jgi:hypothetical protein